MRLRPAPLVAALLAAASTPAPAEVLDYPLALPAHEVAFRIPFDVRYSGTVVVDASWTGGRILTLRVEDPAGRIPPVRLSGPSPQRLRLDVPASSVAYGPAQRVLLLRSRDARSGTGKVTLTLPDDPAVVRAREEAARPKPPPPPPPDPWTLPATMPPAHDPRFYLYERIEAYRLAVIAPDGTRRPDACGWQDDLLRQLASWRDASPPDAGEAALLQRIAAGVAKVEDLRTSKDPLLAGPTPEPGLRQRAWATLREQQLRPLHRELDTLTEQASKGLPPTLSEASWPARMVACLVSGERQIEGVLAGRAPEADPGPPPEPQATLLAAAEAFRALLATRP